MKFNNHRWILLEAMDYLLAMTIMIALGVFAFLCMIHEDREKIEQRLIQLSTSCQMAEMQTGRPYFTGLGSKLVSVENADHLYHLIHKKLINSGGEKN